jgi:hypothetical protein
MIDIIYSIIKNEKEEYNSTTTDVAGPSNGTTAEYNKLININDQLVIKTDEAKRQEKRQKINSYMNEKIDCECGMKVCRAGMSRHKNTELHFNKLKNPHFVVVTKTADEKRQQINSYANEKIDCECGMKVCRAGMSRHKKQNRMKCQWFYNFKNN